MAAVESVMQFGFPHQGDTLRFAANATVSDAIALGGRIPALLLTPATWVTAGVSFEVQVSDNGPWYPLYDNYGTLISVPGTAAGRAYAFPLGMWSGTPRLRAISSAAQTTATALTLVHRHFA